MADRHEFQARSVGPDGETESNAATSGDAANGAAPPSGDPEATAGSKSVWLPAVVPLRSRTKRDDDGRDRRRVARAATGLAAAAARWRRAGCAG